MASFKGAVTSINRFASESVYISKDRVAKLRKTSGIMTCSQCSMAIGEAFPTDEHCCSVE
jgi:hypothetical protein